MATVAVVRACARSLDAVARSSRGATVVGVVLICSVAASSASGPAGAAGIPAGQRLAVLSTDHEVHRGPDRGSPRVSEVAAFRPITGERTALPVVGVSSHPGGVRWLRVMLPGRPNGSSGWIAQQGTRTAATPWRLVAHLNRRVVFVYRAGRLTARFRGVIGKPSTPTPTGSYFVEETVKLGSLEPGGPFALALSARSDALAEFDGGPWPDSGSRP